MKSRDKQYYDSHREEILKKKALYRERKREEIRQKDRERYKQNPDKYKRKQKDYRNNNPEKIKKYLEENREKILERNREYNKIHSEEKNDWYWKNRERVLEQRRENRKQNPHISQRNNRNYVIRVRDKLFEILGGKACVMCGETDDACLQFDHKNGGGLSDVKKHGNSRQLFIYYINNPDEAKRTLQVLCANCNWKKKKKNNENSYQYKLPPID